MNNLKVCVSTDAFMTTHRLHLKTGPADVKIMRKWRYIFPLIAHAYNVFKLVFH